MWQLITRSVSDLHMIYSSTAYAQDALYVGPMNKEIEENPVFNRRLHRIRYIEIAQKKVGIKSRKRKVQMLMAHTGDSNFM